MWRFQEEYDASYTSVPYLRSTWACAEWMIRFDVIVWDSTSSSNWDAPSPSNSPYHYRYQSQYNCASRTAARIAPCCHTRPTYWHRLPPDSASTLRYQGRAKVYASPFRITYWYFQLSRVISGIVSWDIYFCSTWGPGKSRALHYLSSTFKTFYGSELIWIGSTVAISLASHWSKES